MSERGCADLVRTAIVQGSVEMGGETCADGKGQRKLETGGEKGRWAAGGHERAWVRKRVRRTTGLGTRESMDMGGKGIGGNGLGEGPVGVSQRRNGCARKRMKMDGSVGMVRGRVRPVRAQWVKIGGEKGPVDMSERGETVGMRVNGSEWFCVSYKWE